MSALSVRSSTLVTSVLMTRHSSAFDTKVGQLAGNHFLAISSNLDKLAEVGRAVLWEGAKSILIEAA